MRRPELFGYISGLVLLVAAAAAVLRFGASLPGGQTPAAYSIALLILMLGAHWLFRDWWITICVGAATVLTLVGDWLPEILERTRSSRIAVVVAIASVVLPVVNLTLWVVSFILVSRAISGRLRRGGHSGD